MSDKYLENLFLLSGGDMSDEISLKYIGPAVDDGSIEIEDLVSGLRGLVKLSSVIVPSYQPNKKKKVSFRVKNFNNGSFEVILIFIEKHPVLIGGLITPIIVSVIGGYIYYLSHQNTLPDIENKDARIIIEHIIKDKTRTKKCRGGLYDVALPLQDSGIKAVFFGSKESPQEIINQGNKDIFLAKEMNTEEIHKPISMIGTLRALDKKTLNGKFVSGYRTYKISLVMDNPSDYFGYFDQENITITGVTICEKGSGEIIKIEIEKIS